MVTDTQTQAPEKKTRRGKPDNDMQADKRVGMRVRIARIEMGMSQEKLGKALDLTFQQIQKYEKGTNRIASPRLVEIAKILNKPTAYFLQDIQGEHSVVDANAHDRLMHFLTLNGARELVDAFLELDNQHRTALVLLASTAAQPKWNGKT